MNTALNGSPAGRVAIVTGGSCGVGRATIHRLAARGYAVVVNYLHDQRAAESTVEGSSRTTATPWPSAPTSLTIWT